MQPDQVKAIITGGASGLGRAVARYLVAQGGKVVLFDVNAQQGADVVDELGDAARFHLTDVTSEHDVTTNVAAAHETMQGLNAVVNCAGIIGARRVLGRQGPQPLDDFTRTVMVNLTGSFNVAKAGAALMQSNPPDHDGERGVIVNTASIDAFEGQIGYTAYSASKGGVAAMTLPMAREFARFGIRVMAIAPGVFRTAMLEKAPQHVQDALSATIPFPPRPGRPEEFAQTVAFILGNPYLNGETIRLDAAVRLPPK